MEGVRRHADDDRDCPGHSGKGPTQPDGLLVLRDGVLRGDRRDQEDQEYRSVQARAEELLRADRPTDGGYGERFFSIYGSGLVFGKYGDAGEAERVQHSDWVSVLFDTGSTKDSLWDGGMVGLGYRRSEAVDGSAERFQHYPARCACISSQEESRNRVQIHQHPDNPRGQYLRTLRSGTTLRQTASLESAVLDERNRPPNYG
uniref:(northern house mosquito) hypothetical protein n=1 Tax=Culex pipiens TaxID=7175 RepID=A0A8D8NHH8_CULPI